MRNHFISLSTLALIMIGTTPTLGQDAEPVSDVKTVQGDAQPDAQEQTPPEPQLFEFETAGFSFSFSVPFEPVIRESTNALIYAVTIQRRAQDGLALGTDGKMAFVRLTQTIDSIETVGTIDQLLDATVADAFRSIENSYGEVTRKVTSDCSLEILGEERHGRRIDIGLLPSGTLAFVECYAIELENGTGVGITLKIHDPVGDEVPNDVLIADEILTGLGITDLQADTPYYYSLAGYPIQLPVKSNVQSAKRVNEHVIEAGVAYEHGSLRLQTIQVPQGYNVRQTAQDQVRGYDSMLRQQQGSGQLTVLWSADSHLLAGPSGGSVLAGKIYGIRMNNAEFYSAVYAAVDRQNVVMANFTGSIEYATDLAGYAHNFFARPMSSFDNSSSTSYFNGHEISLPDTYSMYGHFDEARLNEFIIAPVALAGWGELVRRPLFEQNGHTRVLSISGESESPLNTRHSALCKELQLMLDGDGIDPLKIAAKAGSHTLSDGRLISTVESSLTPSPGAVPPQNGAGESANVLRVTSYLIPGQNGADSLLFSTVASEQTHADRDLVTRKLIERVRQMTASGHIATGFGSIELPPSEMYAYREQTRGLDDHLTVVWGGDSMEIKVHPEDDDLPTLSSRLLAERYLHPEWNSQVYREEQDLYPADSQDLGEIDVGRHRAVMFESLLDPETEGTTSFRTQPVLQRVIGFLDGKNYVTVTIKQHGEPRAERVERLMSLIQAN